VAIEAQKQKECHPINSLRLEQTSSKVLIHFWNQDSSVILKSFQYTQDRI